MIAPWSNNRFEHRQRYTTRPGNVSENWQGNTASVGSSDRVRVWRRARENSAFIVGAFTNIAKMGRAALPCSTLEDKGNIKPKAKIFQEHIKIQSEPQRQHQWR